jgi:hypothetical protein
MYFINNWCSLDSTLPAEEEVNKVDENLWSNVFWPGDNVVVVALETASAFPAEIAEEPCANAIDPVNPFNAPAETAEEPAVVDPGPSSTPAGCRCAIKVHWINCNSLESNTGVIKTTPSQPAPVVLTITGPGNTHETLGSNHPIMFALTSPTSFGATLGSPPSYASALGQQVQSYQLVPLQLAPTPDTHHYVIVNRVVHGFVEDGIYYTGDDN